MKVHSVSVYLVAIYLVLVGIQEPYHLPLLNGKFQFCDIWFILICLYIFSKWKYFFPIICKVWNNRYVNLYSTFALLFLTTNFISVIHNYSEPGCIEFIGRVYLFIMSIIILILLSSIQEKLFIPGIIKAVQIFGISLSLIGMIGWIASISGYHNETTQIFINYPYFGDTHRLKAFTTTPSMYISMIAICLALSLYNYLFYDKRKSELWLSIFMSITAVLTFSKSVLFIALIWMSLLCFKYYKKSLVIAITLIFFTFFHIVLTHFLFVRNDSKATMKSIDSPYTSNELLYRTESISMFGSGYYTFKKTAWKIFKQHPVFGIGPGNYTAKVAQLKEIGEYPENLPNYDPHSTYIGMLAVSGIPGFISLILLGVCIFYFILKLDLKQNPFSFTLLLIFCIIVAEAISMDTLNFRHYWLFVAILLRYIIHGKSTESI